MKSIRDLALSGRRLFLRVDFNVPLDAGRIEDLHGPVTVAVTLESAGGVARPTGPTVLAGS